MDFSRKQMLRSKTTICLPKAWLRTAIIVIVCNAIFQPAFAAPDKDAKAIVGLLQKGGYVLYWRHASTNHDQRDLPDIDFKDCSSQRNLSKEGEQQAREIGQDLKRLNISFDKITSSPYCRCKRTAELAFGKTDVDSNLYFSIDIEKDKREIQSAMLRKQLSTLPKPGKNSIIISHTANLKEAAEIWPKPEGVIHIFEPKGDHFVHLGKIAPQTWSDL